MSIKEINPANIKALAFDLDGTLLAPGSILTERTKKAIDLCVSRGIKIIIATGRAPGTTDQFRAALGLSGPMVCFNGAVVIDMPGGNILSSVFLNAAAYEYCIDLSRDRNIYFQLYFYSGSDKNEMVLMAEKEDRFLDAYTDHTGMHIEIGNLKETMRKQNGQGCIKGMFLADEEYLDNLRPELEKHFGSSVYLVRSMPTYLEILNAEVSKGTGLSSALSHLNLKKDQVIAFGDEENDLPMFDAAAFSVAPSNAVPAVKAAANITVRSNNEDGIAIFLEELFS